MKYVPFFLSVVVIGSFWGSSAHAAGPRFHAECGHQAWTSYLNGSEDMLPGISEMYATGHLQADFLGGCQFPDWGYRGINPDAAEDSHWTPYHESYLHILTEKYPAPKWMTPVQETASGRSVQFMTPNDDVKRRWAFFLGIICHSVADIPYHFDDGPNLGVLSRTRQEDGTGHGETEVDSDIFTQTDLGGLAGMLGEIWFPTDDILAAYARTSRAANTSQLETGRLQLQMSTNVMGIAGALANRFVEGKNPWLREHYDDYYYGGLKHGAVLTAVCVKYWYARLQGWQYLQNIPTYGGFLKGLYTQPPCEDATLSSTHPANNTGAEPWLEVGGNQAHESRALLRFYLDAVPANERIQEARLWLYLPEAPSSAYVVDAFPVNRAWTEGKGLTNDVDGTDGMPAQANEVTWESARHGVEAWAAAGCGKTPEDCEANPAASTNIAAGGEARWVSWDLTSQAQLWIEDPERNHGLLLQRTQSSISDASPVRFWSSQAFKNQQDGYCGGIHIVGRPALVIITSQK